MPLIPYDAYFPIIKVNIQQDVQIKNIHTLMKKACIKARLKSSPVGRARQSSLLPGNYRVSCPRPQYASFTPYPASHARVLTYPVLTPHLSSAYLILTLHLPCTYPTPTLHLPCTYPVVPGPLTHPPPRGIRRPTTDDSFGLGLGNNIPREKSLPP